jgi:hypothetical protein
MFYRGLFTQHFKLSQKLFALVSEHFNWCPRSIQHPIQECINGSFIRFIQNCSSSIHLEKCSTITNTLIVLYGQCQWSYKV